ncbi:MAG: M1 family peptidase [Balneolaceae bacterium]|nr:MAG: M1 family peptidase [Balneolaceae bacterium]
MSLRAIFFAILTIFFTDTALASATTAASSWQNRVNYSMNIHMDVESHRFSGGQRLGFTNNSPDTLHRVYYHLYFNAFQPGSMMDVRSRTIVDPDGRVRDRIYHLEDHEIGYHRVQRLTQNGVVVQHRTEGTVLIVDLAEPILPGSDTVFEMTFEAQVPVQIRRTGRDNREGIAYSMAHWYPRLAQYDHKGWHTHPYIGREFYGIFGDFDVRITIDSAYVLGGTGYLQNAQEIGHGYEDPALPVSRPDGPELTWHFFAPDVIDFMWAADPDFSHDIFYMENGPRIHLLYVDRPETRFWNVLGDFTAAAIEFINEYIGEYPYEQFSIIQGGDGGMEYPMATLITGHRGLSSLVSVTVHELLHMWFQSVVATNESLYSWIDEGFTVYMQNLTMQHLFRTSGNPHLSRYMAYLRLVDRGLEEPLSTHADHFETNAAFSMGSYSKGAIFLNQLAYVIGEDALKRSLRRFYREWQFRHPGPDDFRRIAEQESGLILNWYFDYMINTTHTIDYGIRRVRQGSDSLHITLQRNGVFPMPVDVEVEYADGHREWVHIPLHMMLGAKDHEHPGSPRTVMPAWFWTHPEYSLTLPGREADVVRIEIDPGNRMADVNRLDNRWPFPVDRRFMRPAVADWNHYGASYRPALWYGGQAGIMAGMRSYGTYLFGNHAMEASFMLTSGPLDGYDAAATDVDYRLSWSNRIRGLGREAFLELAALRYYGISEERATISRRLGRWGALEPVRRVVTLSAYHQARTSNRINPELAGDWERGSYYGFSLGYEHGDPASNGFGVEVAASGFGMTRSGAYTTAGANRTFELSKELSTRFGISAGAGALSMPSQYRWAVSGPTTADLWRNEAYWGIANIDGGFTGHIHLLANDGSGLIGYGLPGIGSPDRPGNNYMTATIWNTFSPFRRGATLLRPMEFELFSGIGKSWTARRFTDFPKLTFGGGSGDNGDGVNGGSDPILASVGVGVTYDVSALPWLSRWVPQSRLLQNLQLSVRMPFFLNGLQGHDDFGARFVIGVSERF